MKSLRILALLPAVLLLATAGAGAAPCAMTTGDFDGNGVDDVRVTGNSLKQTLKVVIGDPDTTVSLDCNGDGDFLDAAIGDSEVTTPGGFYTYDLQLGGADVITVQLTGNWSGRARAVEITLGAGNNGVTLDGSGATLGPGSRLLVDVAGYTAIDTLTAKLPGLDSASFTLRTDLSTGNDEARFELGGDVVNGSVADIDIFTGAGNSVIAFTHPAGVTVGSASRVLFAVEGGTTVDTVTTAWAGTISGGAREVVDVDLGNGNDKYTGSLDLASFDLVGGAELRVDVIGGNGSDQMSFGRGASAGGATALDSGLLDLHLNGGPSDDVIAVDLAGGGMLMTGGTLALRANGGAGNDTLNVALQADPASVGANFDVVLNGAGQTDTMSVTLDAPAGTTFGSPGQVLLDGSFGLDSCTIGGSAAASVHKRNCP